MSWRIRDARHWSAARRAPSVSGMTHAIFHHIPRGRSLAWAGALFGLLWTAVPVALLASSDPTAWEIALAAVGLVAFAYSFLAVAVMERGLLGPMIAMLAISDRGDPRGRGARLAVIMHTQVMRLQFMRMHVHSNA